MLLQDFMKWDQARTPQDSLQEFLRKYFANKTDKQVFESIILELHSQAMALGELAVHYYNQNDRINFLQEQLDGSKNTSGNQKNGDCRKRCKKGPAERSGKSPKKGGKEERKAS